MIPEQRSAYLAQQMSQFQGKHLNSMFSKGRARGSVCEVGGEFIPAETVTEMFLKSIEGKRGGLQGTCRAAWLDPSRGKLK